VLFGGLGANLISYGSDQVVVQRYLTTKDEKSAANSVWISAIMTVPASIIFFGLGTALYVFYKEQPQLLDVSLDISDAIFPHFIVAELPQGVAGLLIAGIFAAAMSSLDSSMNSVATVITTDFYQRFRPDSEEHTRLKIAKWATGIVGVSGTIFALFMASWDIKSLWDQLNTFIGLFAGGLGGLFLLGICTRKANGAGAVIGLVMSGLVQFAVKEYSSVHFLL
jgi:Na+/proline symporter